MMRFFSVLSLLCLFLTAAAQDNSNNNIINTTSVELKIGQSVPDAFVTRVTGLKINAKEVSSFRLSELRGKLVILDFWATWCSPCRKMVPLLDSLQKAFGERILILPVTYQNTATVGPVLAQLQKIKPFHRPEITSDTVLHTLFPHRSLPHFVWIDGAGTVRAITEEKEINAKNIQKMLDNSSGASGLTEKKDVRTAYNTGAPFLLASNGGDGSAVIFHSILTGYIPGIGSGLRISPLDPVSGQLFTVRNNTFTWLCRMAFNEQGRWFQDAQIRILSRDSAGMNNHLFGQAFDDWLASGHGYCYELLVPPSAAGHAFSLLQGDLQRYFPQYRVTVEKTVTRCLALIRLSPEDKLRSTGGERHTEVSPFGAHLKNSTLSQLMMRLRLQYLQGSHLPVMDATGYSGPVDLDIDAKMYDVASLNSALAKYDLAFREQDAPVELLVIRDNSVSGTKP